jgi:SpoVK/Ycf46/Vps4 family AAA+-type ATPase
VHVHVEVHDSKGGRQTATVTTVVGALALTPEGARDSVNAMSKNATQIPTPQAVREAQLAHLDAVCHWAEAQVDLRTAESWAPADDVDAAAYRKAVPAAQARLDATRNALAGLGVVPPFDALALSWELDDTDVQILRLALAPVLDSTFRKRIARFKDNVLLDYPDVDFLLSMLRESRVERMRLRERFLPGSPLVDAKLIRLSLPRDAGSDSLLSYEVRLPDRVVSFLLGHDHLDRTIAPFCGLSRPDAALDRVVMDPTVLERVVTLAGPVLQRAMPGGPGVTFGFGGPSGTGKTLLAAAIAASGGRPLITVDSTRMAALEPLTDDILDAVFQEATMRRAVLVFDSCEALFGSRNPRMPALFARLDRHPGVAILCTTDSRQLDPAVERHVGVQVEFDTPDIARRERLWTLHLDGDACDGTVDLPSLSLTFEFTGGQIANATVVARSLCTIRKAAALSQDDLQAGAWAQIRADMEEYAHRRKIPLTLEDLILPPSEMTMVRDVLDAAKHRTFILTHWGFAKRMPTGRGLCCLFVGDPGTGKTLCAEILAEQLGQTLYQISIPRVMSKYIGETEKNIEKIFQTARANNSILLFDEADALFTSRVKVDTSVDRFSNMEINLLLQEIERFDGISLLTTNLEKNMDKAFERRIQFKIRFPFPDKAHRAQIWKSLIPRECPIDPDIDWDRVGESFELSGGNIKNAILRAAYRAARDGRRIGMDHIVDSAEAECRHAGRLFRGLKRED